MFSIIAVVSKNNCIGKDNDLLWHLKDDLKRFKSITLNHKMIMGRKCFESLPGILPNRKSIIVTKNTNYKINNDEVKMCYDLDKFINDNKDTEEEIFVIGGGEIYKYFLPYSNKLYLTHVDSNYDGDVYFPNIDYELYTKTFVSDIYFNELEKVKYCFINYELKKR